ncbi:hypothetical protein Pyn_07169 [Prunus yedoensis var. nudiflora]|uniref:Uncharacterized protein n=1 Tax=Prunus yedoensis var. nudiflora TaxID=2094558 RepID=A0A314Z9E4_PRUYE|nr:hypothetical protein Pyn_07169 [Prunus yedoensis var. nudiflora]
MQAFQGSSGWVCRRLITFCGSLTLLVIGTISPFLCLPCVQVRKLVFYIKFMEQRLSLIQQECLSSLSHKPDSLMPWQKSMRGLTRILGISALPWTLQINSEPTRSLVQQSQELMPMRTAISILLL